MLRGTLRLPLLVGGSWAAVSDDAPTHLGRRLDGLRRGPQRDGGAPRTSHDACAPGEVVIHLTRVARRPLRCFKLPYMAAKGLSGHNNGHMVHAVLPGWGRCTALCDVPGPPVGARHHAGFGGLPTSPCLLMIMHVLTVTPYGGKADVRSKQGRAFHSAAQHEI